MQLIEVKAAALRNTSGLVWPHNCDQLRSKSGELDVLDWLGVIFGKRDNVRNQRENLIMLLANVHVKLIPSPRLDERAVDHVVKKLFCNYKRWCKYMNEKDNINLPRDLFKLQMPRLKVQQRKILYLGLHLLIWEAANVRFLPCPPRVREMLSFSVMTPYYSEETVYSESDLGKCNEDGVSIVFYLKKVFPDEWENFTERLDFKEGIDMRNEEKVLQLLHWASLRGQTLLRTIRGMMYNRWALKHPTFLDIAIERDIAEGHKPVALAVKEDVNLNDQLEAIADMKFTYVATCQNYGNQKRQGNRHATDILNFMVKYPSLRVAYIDDVEVKEGENIQKVYYSVLIKAVENLDQEIYRIKLPSSAKIGEGKPENQNHAIIFTRGEALQTIDMNQDFYLEEAFKMRNLLEEFNEDHGVHPPSILGVREHIFTGSVSSLAWFMSSQETSFVTIGQRVLARLLKVRFHYGHPDVFDRIFHITRGGISKASRVINLSEDIFAGFNSTLRDGNITHHEYIQVGKGRDVGLNQISIFEAKVACGNGEQTLSRDIYRLGHLFDFFRMLSCFFTTGFYVNSVEFVLVIEWTGSSDSWVF